MDERVFGLVGRWIDGWKNGWLKVWVDEGLDAWMGKWFLHSIPLHITLCLL